MIEDVRDALESQLWYMRLEGGRYRFTTEPNLNKVVLEREAAIGEDRIVALLRESLSQVAPTWRRCGPSNGSMTPRTFPTSKGSRSAYWTSTGD